MKECKEGDFKPDPLIDKIESGFIDFHKSAPKSIFERCDEIRREAYDLAVHHGSSDGIDETKRFQKYCKYSESVWDDKIKKRLTVEQVVEMLNELHP